MMNQRAYRWVQNTTIVTDLLLINFGFYLAYLTRYVWQLLREVEPQFFLPYRAYLGQQLLVNLILIIALTQVGSWRRRRGEFYVDEVARVVYAMGIMLIVMMAYQNFVRPVANSRIMLFWAALYIGGLISFARLARRFLLRMAYRRGRGVDRVLVVGSGETGRGVIRTLLARPDLGFNAVGFLDDGQDNLGSRKIPHLGSWDQLARIIKDQRKLHTVFIAFPAERHKDILALTKICLDNGLRAQIVPDLFQLSLGRLEINNMGGIPVIGVRDLHHSRIARAIKRLMDLGIVLAFAPFAIPVTLLIALAIKLDDGGPIFYKAQRFGKGGKPFSMYKFRSMILDADKMRAQLWEQNEADGAIFKIKDDPRLTRVGRFIRQMSLDELPQFYNIFIGDMSFVGPRPPIADEVEQYGDWHYRRLDVKGGLTGLWQVSGRADLTFDEACLLDIYYIENWSLALDLRIVLQTIPYILLRRGAY